MKKAFFILVILFSNLIFGQEAQNITLSDAALVLTKQQVTYDPSYYSISYPNGDIPNSKGVCTDVIIRAYRMLDIDLQREVHEDMKANFNKYPKIWGLTSTDKNIDQVIIYLEILFVGIYLEELLILAL